LTGLWDFFGVTHFTQAARSYALLQTSTSMKSSMEYRWWSVVQ